MSSSTLVVPVEHNCFRVCGLWRDSLDMSEHHCPSWSPPFCGLLSVFAGVKRSGMVKVSWPGVCRSSSDLLGGIHLSFVSLFSLNPLPVGFLWTRPGSAVFCSVLLVCSRACFQGYSRLFTLYLLPLETTINEAVWALCYSNHVEQECCQHDFWSG